MKRITACLFAASIFISISVSAQDWVGMMHNPSVNVHDVQAAFYKWHETHKTKNDKSAGDLKRGRGEEENYELFKRWEHRMVVRTFPSGNRPDPIEIAKEYKDFLSSSHKDKASHKALATPAWVYVGNTDVPTYGGDGRVNRVHFYPGNTNTIYACSPAGGLWVSTDGGNTWSTNTDQLGDLGLGDLAINPLKPTVMYLGTGDNDAGGDLEPSTIGVLRSSDGGNTWNATGMSFTLQVSGPQYYVINQLIFNPADTGTLFAATSFGLFYTQKDGKNWNKVLTDNIKDLEFEPFHSSTVYAASNAGIFYRSIDSGKTFIRVISGLPAHGMQRMAIGTTVADSNVVYLLTVDSANYGFYGLYRSTDRGQTFSPRSVRSTGAPNLLGWSNTGSDSSGQAWYNLVIKVSPTYSDSVLVAGSWLWSSADGGATWTFNNNFYNNVHIDIHSINFFPGSSSSFLLSSDGGVFKTTDGGITWTDLSNNLAIGEQYCIGASADNPSLWITGWQDNGSSISVPYWQSVYGGDGMTCFIDYTSDNNLFASYENGALAASFDGGFSWYPANNGITETGDWNTPWLQDPQQPNNLFAGYQNVWESYNQGSSWTQLSTWGTYYINALAVAPSNDQYIYASEYFKLYGTTDGGTIWNDITGTLPVAYAYISGIAVDPNNPSRLWVSFSGWDGSFKVFKSINGGSSWANVSSGLPNLPVNCIVYQAGTADGIYVGTDMGVYYRDNNIGAWIPYNNGLPNVEVDNLQVYAPGNFLVAATFGRGTWQVPTYVGVGINEVSFTNSVKVYPSPAHGSVNVAFEGPAGEYEINLINVLGQKVLSRNLKTSGQYNGTIDLSGYTSGVYMVSISGANTKTDKKIVVY
jgi:photosystem II stability/assembly factor-like uncharacterized protein